jgi:ABC-type transporter Mla subunit MlaD
MVEVNTVFEQLTSVLSKIDSAKLNETLGAIASAVNGRGEKVGQMLSDLDSYLAKIEPSLPALSRDLGAAPDVLRAYADAAPDFRRSPTTPRGSATRWSTRNRISTLLVRDRPGRHRHDVWARTSR